MKESTSKSELLPGRRLVNAAVLLLAVFAWSAAGADKPRLTLDEFFNSFEITAAELAPDGHMAAIGTARADWENERFRNDLWLWRDSDNALIPLTQSGHDRNPVWSPDGRWVAFLSDRKLENVKPGATGEEKKEITQLYVIPVSGGEAFAVTQGEEDVHSFDWTPDSRALVFASRVPLQEKEKEDQKKEWKDTIRYREQERGDIISRISVEDALTRRMAEGTGTAGRQSEKGRGSSGRAGAGSIVQTVYRVKNLAVSPDGSQVAFVTDSVSERFEDVDANEIYVAGVVNPQRNNAPRRLTKNEAVEEQIRWSPDGRSIFFAVSIGSVGGRYADVQPRIYSIEAATGQTTRWASDFGGSITRYAVSRDRGLLAPGMLGTATALYLQPSAQAEFRRLNGWPGSYGRISVAGNSPRILFTYSELDRPTEVYLAENADRLNEAKPVTSFNKLFTERDLPKGKSYRWTSTDGTPVEGMLVYPPGKYEKKHLRLFVLIHGGPIDADGNRFEADWYDWAMLAASHDWLVFRPNYRGSAGYGDKFTLAIAPELVSSPGRDILSGVDALVKDGIANPVQMVIGGYSYGGYMTNWLITQTNEFKAAVTGAGAVEHTANWGNDDTTRDDDFYLGGEPWDPAAKKYYISEAAIYQFNKVKTPTHIVAGEKDIRVAVSENYLLEHALHALRIPNTLLIFPGEGHSLAENPWHGKIKVREELKWLEKYCRCPAQ